MSLGAHTRPHVAESGFTMIQMLVVLVIIAVVTAILAVPISGARRDGQRRQAIEAARTLSEAIDRFRLDHGERPPRLGTAQDWPTGANGPRNALTGARYMKTTPDGLGEWLPIAAAGNANAQWALVYRATTTAPHGFRIDVIYRNSAATPSCSIVVDRAPASIYGTVRAC